MPNKGIYHLLFISSFCHFKSKHIWSNASKICMYECRFVDTHGNKRNVEIKSKLSMPSVFVALSTFFFFFFYLNSYLTTPGQC